MARLFSIHYGYGFVAFLAASGAVSHDHFAVNLYLHILNYCPYARASTLSTSPSGSPKNASASAIFGAWIRGVLAVEATYASDDSTISNRACPVQADSTACMSNAGNIPLAVYKLTCQAAS